MVEVEVEEAGRSQDMWPEAILRLRAVQCGENITEIFKESNIS